MKLRCSLFAAAIVLLFLSASAFAGELPCEKAAFDKAVAEGRPQPERRASSQGSTNLPNAGVSLAEAFGDPFEELKQRRR